METYKITTHGFNGEHTHERWFSTKKDAKEYSMSLVRLGYTPYASVYSSDYTKSKMIYFFGVSVFMFWKGVYY